LNRSVLVSVGTGVEVVTGAVVVTAVVTAVVIAAVVVTAVVTGAVVGTVVVAAVVAGGLVVTVVGARIPYGSRYVRFAAASAFVHVLRRQFSSELERPKLDRLCVAMGATTGASTNIHLSAC